MFLGMLSCFFGILTASRFQPAHTHIVGVKTRTPLRADHKNSKRTFFRKKVFSII